MRAYEATNAALKALEQAHEALDKAATEVSHLESQFCEATEGHDWQPREPDDVMTEPWEECSRCGCGRSPSVQTRA